MTDDETMHNGISSFLGAMAVGAAIGAGIALLFAPRSGRDTRERIANKSRQLKHKGEEMLEHAKDEVTETVQSAQQAVTH